MIFDRQLSSKASRTSAVTLYMYSQVCDPCMGGATICKFEISSCGDNRGNRARTQKYAVPRICVDASAAKENAQDRCNTLDTASRPRTAMSLECTVTSRRLTFESGDRAQVKRSFSCDTTSATWLNNKPTDTRSITRVNIAREGSLATYSWAAPSSSLSSLPESLLEFDDLSAPSCLDRFVRKTRPVAVRVAGSSRWHTATSQFLRQAWTRPWCPSTGLYEQSAP
jgi:hypothetical protein